MRRIRALGLACFGILPVALAAQSDGPAAFVAWAKRHAHPIATAEPGHRLADLRPMRDLVGGARVVGVGENIHGIREFLGLRHRMVEFLVREMGFTAVALETGLPDSKMVYDYVLGAPAARELWNQGFTWTMASFGETRDLIEWMRAYNRDPAHPRKIRFYGMDVAGGNGSWAPALGQVLAYLERVEPAYAAVFRESCSPWCGSSPAAGTPSPTTPTPPCC